MYKTIVIAYDGTDAGQTVLRQGAELARLCKAELHLLGIVVSSGGLLLDPAIVPLELLETERSVLLTAMTDTVHDLHRRGITAVTAIRDGEVSREIEAYIHEVKADCVVVGHSHKGLMSRWFEGSVGTRLLDALPCSLLVAAAPAEQPATYL